MKVRPILFSAPMIRALLAGTKTQTRRIVKPRGRNSLFELEEDGSPMWTDSYVLDPGNAEWRMADNPYGRPGDLLWVKENHYRTDDGHCDQAVHAADDEAVREHLAVIADLERSHPSSAWATHKKLRPSIHMPRWASRLTLEITEVQVERLRDITAADALAEGVLEPSLGQVAMIDHGNPVGPVTRADVPPLVLWEFLWKRVNGDASWDANPWVWAISFKVHRQNVDALLTERGAA